MWEEWIVIIVVLYILLMVHDSMRESFFGGHGGHGGGGHGRGYGGSDGGFTWPWFLDEY